ncbi:MAG: sulfatase-like hydrolase/transferase [Pseudomonadota bacterium]
MAYAILNQHLLTQSILYRAAANDYSTAIGSIFSFGIQSLLLLAAVVALPRRWFVGMLIVVTISSGVNVVFGQLVNDTINLQKTAWLFTEARQAGNAASEFAVPTIMAFCKLAVAVSLLIGARKAMHQPVSEFVLARLPRQFVAPLPILLMALAPSLVWPATGFGPEAAERNVYGHLLKIATAAPPPDRAKVEVEPQRNLGVQKIVWLVDESITHEIFAKMVLPDIAEPAVLEFGEIASLGNCSTPAVLALRSGVNVRKIHEKTDLRTTASIWGYARKAGYETRLIDGQVSGPPQNLLLAPERELIDEYLPMKDGLQTDVKIARHVNEILKSDGKNFILAQLKGVHFQYSDHFPKTDPAANGSIMEQYSRAVAYSKEDFFAELFKDVDRSKVAIFYTSDHGQNIGPGLLPHCSVEPAKAEFSVPLLAFLPPGTLPRYAGEKSMNRSASQIFPTTLQLMGYPDAYARENYDNDLASSTVQYVWFGRGIVPVHKGGTIELHKPDDFPGR